MSNNCKKHREFSPEIVSMIDEAFAEKTNLFSKLDEHKIDELENIIKAEEKSVALAIKYILSSLPDSDVFAYPLELYINTARHSIMLLNSSPFCKDISEEVFLKYILMPRVNNEELSDCRELFYSELWGRICDKEIVNAALDANIYCAENVRYQSTDNRTVSALEAYGKGYGRCGEESTFAVNVFRSVGIPARQVYAPFWSHCDDNHAWVEIYVNGEWKFLGACEPEPILNRGWFVSAATRAMLIYARAFAPNTLKAQKLLFPNEKNCYISEGIYFENVISNYADTVCLKIAVKNGDKPCKNVSITLEILNMSAYREIFRIETDEGGKAEIELGKGSVKIKAKSGDMFIEKLINTAKTQKLNIDFSESISKTNDGKTYNKYVDVDFTPPKDSAKNESTLTDEQKAKNAEVCEKAESIRAEKHSKAQSSPTGLEEILSVMSDKDRAYISKSMESVLFSHRSFAEKYRAEHDSDKESTNVFRKYILNPRISKENITDYRSFIDSYFAESDKDSFRENPNQIGIWIDKNIDDDDKTYSDIISTPEVSIINKKATKESKSVLFVAICRTIGIPARLNPYTQDCEFMNESGDFVSLEKERKANLTIVFDEETMPSYEGNFTLSRIENSTENKVLNLQNILSESAKEKEEIKISLPIGEYKVITSNRLPSGKILAKELYFTLDENKEKTIKLEYAKADISDMIQRIKISDFKLLNAENKKTESNHEIGAGKIYFWLETSKEPTEHILNEIIENKDEFNKISDELVFIIKNEFELENETFKKAIKSLDKCRIYYDDFKENVNSLSRKMYKDPDKLPLILMTDNEQNAVFAESGYNVGTAQMLLKIKKELDKML